MAMNGSNDSEKVAHDRKDNSNGPSAALLKDPTHASHSQADDVEGLATPDQKKLRNDLYASRLFSIFSTVFFEYSVPIPFFGQIFPRIMQRCMIYVGTRALLAICLSSTIEKYLNGVNRLLIVRWSLAIQQVAIVASCITLDQLKHNRCLGEKVRMLLFSGLIVVACAEKLAALAFSSAVESNWNEVVARGNPNTVRALQSRSFRIELIGKCSGIFVAAMLIGTSFTTACLVIPLLSIAGAFFAYPTIANTYQSYPFYTKESPVFPEAGTAAASTEKTNISDDTADATKPQ